MNYNITIFSVVLYCVLKLGMTMNSTKHYFYGKQKLERPLLLIYKCTDKNFRVKCCFMKCINNWARHQLSSSCGESTQVEATPEIILIIFSYLGSVTCSLKYVALETECHESTHNKFYKAITKIWQACTVVQSQTIK